MFFNSSKQRYIYIFQHVPKCAGTSIIEHLDSQLKGQSINLEKKYDYKYQVWGNLVRQKPDVHRIVSIHGHRVFYGLHAISDRQPRYYTFLRNPVDRVVSLYNFWADSKARRSLMYRDGKLIPFREFIETEYASNNIIRFLYHAMAGELTPGGQLDFISHHHISVAKAFLDKCWFIGFVESFEQDFHFLNSCLGISHKPKHQRVSKKYFEISQDPDVVDRLLTLNQPDTELFEYARTLRQAQEKMNPVLVEFRT